jgi:glycosyltransferase involved in cell wall biosynthesis
MTYGNSLQTWLSHGILDRELAIYREHIKHGNQVTIFSYGNESDAEIIKKYDGIRLLYNKWAFHPRIYANISPLLFYNEFKNASIFKTNQMAGSHIAVRVKRIVNRPLIVRQGYSHYGHRELEYGPKSAETRRALAYERYCYSNADALFFTTREMLNSSLQRQKMTTPNAFVMPNYVVEHHWTPKFSQPDTNQKNRILFFGRLTKQKNLENLIAAMQDTRSSLLIVGDGPNKEILREASKKMNVATVLY